MHVQKMAEHTCAKGSWSVPRAQGAFESVLDVGNALCAMCSINLADATLEDISANATELPQPKLSECLYLVSGSCPTEEADTTKCPVCLPDVQCCGYKISFTPKIASTSSSPETLPSMYEP